MKKTLIILFLILLPFCLYSIGYQRSTVVIKTTVTTISLSDALARSDGIFGLYRLSGGLYQGSSGTDYLVANDISEDDIIVYFQIDQMAETRTDESIQLSISANRLTNVDADTVLQNDREARVETDFPSISVVSCADMSAIKVSSVPIGINEVLFTLRYLGYRTIENMNLVVFKTTWNKTMGLAPGMYTSDVTLSYIIN